MGVDHAEAAEALSERKMARIIRRISALVTKQVVIAKNALRKFAIIDLVQVMLILKGAPG